MSSSALTGAAAGGAAGGPWGAAIGAGAGLMSDYFGGVAARKRQERKAKIDAAQKSGELQAQAHGQTGRGQQGALASLMSAYRDALVR